MVYDISSGILDQLCKREFGPYNANNTVTLNISANKLINMNEYFSIINCELTGGIANITLSGDWSKCKFIIGTQLITLIDRQIGGITTNNSEAFAIPYCKLQNYYLDIQVTGNTVISFDNIEFETPIIFANSHINDPNSYYVKKINTMTIINTNCAKHCDLEPINYLRFMSDCAGLAF
jgi:hypothetical protein